MAEKKKASDKRTPRPEMLGTGGAAVAGSKIVERRKATCDAAGGKWNAQALRCEW